MAHTAKVIEQCQVSPPPGSVPSSSIPLTFFDLPWLCCPPLKRIFFYDFPHSTQHFFQTLLPTLKHSLSLTLQHFFPFSSNLVFPPKPNAPHILYSHGDSISFTVAESTADFTTLVSDSPRDVTDLHPFVPVLPPPRTLEDGTFLIPLMAIQVTVVSHSGFAICITFRHVAADGRAFHHFMKFWASLYCRNRPEFSIPLEYFGNCLVCGNVAAKRSKLMGGNGILEAAIAIGSEVRHLQIETFEGAETLMSNFREFATLGKHMTIIAGSPTLEVYETDFGWGKPMRSEVVHVDNSGSISLSDCRDKKGRIEVGLALQKIQMNKLSIILEEHLKEIAVLD
ncbi:Coumaroyl-CoA:anthocyanidin 3-O-glucoside-6''-O-coumaroyltransferase 1 [Spatholobus suberectus]|nr:Coumaroyl-CoA:anthocyanidin 3-O-glucoside-6''-O-coumaroyltransferase 1 [Spatholobus suberectus]